MPATDYNQQLLCYLQNWRQLLEQWAAMAARSPLLTGPAGGPLMPPFMPFMQSMPPMPPMPMGPMAPPMAPVSPAPPAPADYAQQLFSYLQAWRQYLEQATGAAPVPTQAWTAWQPPAGPAGDAGKAGSQPSPDAPVPPGDGYASKGAPQSDDENSSTSTWPPKLVYREPGKYYQSQLTAVSSDPAATPFDGPHVDRPHEQFQMADPATLAARPAASRPVSQATARPEVGSAFLRTINSVGPIASAPVARSLFSAPSASAQLRDAGETRSP
ncbi:hypothetical protein SKC41_24310 [Mycobacterium sp. 050128]|uniref:hypothetical protein n=1 Tax=Mycobacterium sp. 050128 TaxID=3096112 RepID=UPI002ED9ABD5